MEKKGALLGFVCMGKEVAGVWVNTVISHFGGLAHASGDYGEEVWYLTIKQY